jgi:hypothetical protein
VKAPWIVFVLAISTLAAADPTVDEALAQAEALAKQGDFVGAAGKFKLAHAHDPRPELICNIGVAYYKAKQLPRAQLFLNRCLERGTALDAKFVASVRQVLESVEAALRSGEFTPIDIVVEPAGASVTVEAFGGDESFIGSRVVWLAHGKHRLIARAEGYIDQSIDLEAQGRDMKQAKITLERAPIEPGTGGVTTPAGSGSATVIAPEPRPIEYARPSKLPAIAATSVSVASLALAIVSYQRAHDRAELAKYALNADAYATDKSSVGTWNTMMVSGAVISVATAGLAGFLWSRALRSPSVELQATGSSIAVSGRW